jgi:hypothetical protein
MIRLSGTIGISLLAATFAWGQDPEVVIPPVERKALSLGGYAELRPALLWPDTSAAQFKLQSLTGGSRSTPATQLNARLLLEMRSQRGWFSAQALAVGDGSYANTTWSGAVVAYEAYLSVKPIPALTVDAGKKTMKWGKGYLWNPAAFLDRQKSPEDPALALEGFTVLTADWIRTFGGPLQVLSITPVVLPVSGALNNDFGETDHVNFAGKLYVLLFDTDIDAMYLSGGSRPGRFGFDVSRNLRSNLEVHAEWARLPRTVAMSLRDDGTLLRRTRGATNYVLGLRYLTEANTTYILDYFHSGSGYSAGETEAYFDFVHDAYDSLLVAGDDRLLTLAHRATEAGFGRPNPMRNYVYTRVSQPDALGVLYLSLGASAIVNLDDRSYALLPEVQFKPMENLELRGMANIQRGGTRTEFGEKRADVRFEVRGRYYF